MLDTIFHCYEITAHIASESLTRAIGAQVGTLESHTRDMDDTFARFS